MRLISKNLEFKFSSKNTSIYDFYEFMDKCLEARTNLVLSSLYPDSVIKTLDYFIIPTIQIQKNEMRAIY